MLLKGKEDINFTTTDGQVFTQHHEQDCCEEVWLEDIDGDLNDIIGDQILVAEEVSSEGELRAGSKQYNATWTFYKLDTIKGGITIRWNGESNGCYSEKAELYMA